MISNLFNFPKLDNRMENQEQLQQGVQGAPTEDSVTLSRGEYDKLRQTAEDYKASTKEAQKLHWIADIARDNTKFLKLYESDKTLAKLVAKHFDRDASDLYAELKGEGGVVEGISKEEATKNAEAIAQKIVAQQNLEAFVKKFGIEGKLKEVFDAEMEELMGSKKRTPEEVEKQAKRALRLIRDTDEFQKALEANNSKLAGAGISGSSRKGSGNEKSPYQKIKEEQRNGSLLAKYGISKDF
ncbi:MAG: hypothetical protein DLD55_01770 [candidate division SR1 bacterium]|nr:MAG: hypothetical protein DLD55_01770 [candidate division SR1 bacterium]